MRRLIRPPSSGSYHHHLLCTQAEHIVPSCQFHSTSAMLFPRSFSVPQQQQMGKTSPSHPPVNNASQQVSNTRKNNLHRRPPQQAAAPFEGKTLPKGSHHLMFGQKETKSRLATTVEKALCRAVVAATRKNDRLLHHPHHADAWTRSLQSASKSAMGIHVDVDEFNERYESGDAVGNNNNNNNNSATGGGKDEQDDVTSGWVPITQLTRSIPEEMLEDLERYKNGLREVIATELSQTCEIELRAATKTWMARHRPVPPVLLDLANAVELIMLQLPPTMENQRGMSHAMDHISPLLDPVLKRKVEAHFRVVTRAIAQAEEVLPDLNIRIERQFDHTTSEKYGHGRARVAFIKRPTQAQRDQAMMMMAGRRENQTQFADGHHHHNHVAPSGDQQASPPSFSKNNSSASFSAGDSGHGAGDATSSSSSPHAGVSFDPPENNNMDPEMMQIPDVCDEAAMCAVGNANNTVNDNDHHNSSSSVNARMMRYHYSPGARRQMTVEPSTSDMVGVSAVSLLQYVPSFFIPAEEVLRDSLSDLGYTLQHIQEYFASTRALQIVTLPATTKNNTQRSFVRFHGRRGEFDMSPIAAVNERYAAKYAPSPAAAEPFLKTLAAKEEEDQERKRKHQLGSTVVTPPAWMSLRELFEKTAAREQMTVEDLAATLPQFHSADGDGDNHNQQGWGGLESLIYFSQLQHLFLFSPQNGGMVAKHAASSPVTNLVQETTPCPLFFNEVHRLTQVNSAPLSAAEQQLPPAALAEFRKFFKSWEEFAAVHAHTFLYLPPAASGAAASGAGAGAGAGDAQQHQPDAYHQQDPRDTRGSIALRRTYLTDEVRRHGIEAEYAFSKQFRSHRMTVGLRKRIVLERDPDNPLLDLSNLADAVHGLLPEAGHVTLQEFRRYMIPQEIMTLLPRYGLFKFLMKYPRHFKFFDLTNVSGLYTTCVMRCGLPVPEGGLVESLSDRDIVLFIVTRLQRAGGNESTAAWLLKAMPAMTRHNMRYVEDVLNIVAMFPESFVTIERSADHVCVRLVRPPTHEELEERLQQYRMLKMSKRKVVFKPR